MNNQEAFQYIGKVTVLYEHTNSFIRAFLELVYGIEDDTTTDILISARTFKLYKIYRDTLMDLSELDEGSFIKKDEVELLYKKLEENRKERNDMIHGFCYEYFTGEFKDGKFERVLVFHKNGRLLREYTIENLSKFPEKIVDLQSEINKINEAVIHYNVTLDFKDFFIYFNKQ